MAGRAATSLLWRAVALVKRLGRMSRDFDKALANVPSGLPRATAFVGRAETLAGLMDDLRAA